MKIKYLGTAAAERVPAVFCKCEVCQNAIKNRGREIRTQTQSLLDDGKIMIDFSGDSYLHRLTQTIDYNDIEHLLITHWHSDHFYGEDLAYRMKGYAVGLDKKMHVYGNAEVKKFYDRAFGLEGQEDNERLEYHLIEPYKKFQIADYWVYPIPARHGHNQQDCFIYAIKDKDGKTIFYGHDTGYPNQEMLDYMEKENLKFDLVSMDCTGQLSNKMTVHMNWEENLQFRKELIGRKLATNETIFVANHFSHNGGLTYAQMSDITNQENIITAYDGMEVSF